MGRGDSSGSVVRRRPRPWSRGNTDLPAEQASDVTATGSAGVVHRPEHTDLQQIVADAVDSATGSDGRAARVWVASGRAAGLRRLATSSTPAVFDGEDGDDLVIEIRSLSTLARMILAVGPDAVVREPAELRDLVVAGLDRIGGVNA